MASNDRVYRVWHDGIPDHLQHDLCRKPHKRNRRTPDRVSYSLSLEIFIPRVKRKSRKSTPEHDSGLTFYKAVRD